MKIPFLWLALGLTLGILTSSVINFQPVWIWAVSLPLMPVLWLCRGKKYYLGLAVFLMAGLGYMHAHENKIRPVDGVEFWASEAAVHRIHLEGVVLSEPETKLHGRKQTVSFILNARNLVWFRNGQREYYEIRGKVQVFCFQIPIIPSVGDRVRLSGRLEKPSLALNPGQFDYPQYLAKSDIYAIFTAYGQRAIKIIRHEPVPFLRDSILKVRGWMVRRIERFFQGEPRAMIKALVLGMRKDLNQNVRDDFVATGTAHILAISGLNISLVAGSLYFLLIAMRIPQKVAAFMGLFCAVGYVLISGAEIPVQRAGWMAGAAFAAILLDRENQFWNSYFLSFFILLLADPRYLTNVSFQLSYLSIFSIVYLVPGFLTHWRWKENLGQGIAVLLGTFPVILFYFNIFSTTSLVANLLAIPLFHIALLAGSSVIAIGDWPVVGSGVIAISEQSLGLAVAWIHCLAKLKWGYFYLPTPSLWQLFLYYLFLGIAWNFKRFSFLKKISWFGAVSTAIWIFVTVSFFWGRGTVPFSLTILAAGKNDLAHVQWNSRIHWLLNTGRSGVSEQARWIVRPYLKELGINRLSGVLMFDRYRKHTGGLDMLLNEFGADYVAMPEAIKGRPLLDDGAKRNRPINRVTLTSGTQIKIHPQGEMRVLAVVKGQIILEIIYGQWRFIFLPNLSSEIMNELERHREEMSHIRYLILSSYKTDPTLADKRLEMRLFDILDPEVVVLPYADDAFQEFLSERDIRCLNLLKTGAVTFSVICPRAFGTPISQVSVSTLTVETYLKQSALTIG